MVAEPDSRWARIPGCGASACIPHVALPQALQGCGHNLSPAFALTPCAACPTSPRRRGLATEALRLFIAYLHRHLGVVRFTAKIGDANAPSIAMFTQRLGFKEIRRVPVGAVRGIGAAGAWVAVWDERAAAATPAGGCVHAL
jgi:hypothetical protein